MTNEFPKLKGLFASRYKLHGRDWIRLLDPDDRAVLVHGMMSAGLYGVLGGLARSRSAVRDNHGRFMRKQDDQADAGGG